MWLRMKMEKKDNAVTVTQVDTSVKINIFIYCSILK